MILSVGLFSVIIPSKFIFAGSDTAIISAKSSLYISVFPMCTFILKYDELSATVD